MRRYDNRGALCFATAQGTIYTRYGSSGAIDTEKQPGSPTLKRHESASMRRLGSFMSRAGGRTPRRRVSLAKMANFAERMAQRRWRLVVTGHSLGAGVASLIALKLKPRFPNLHCWAYASPGTAGRLFSMGRAELRNNCALPKSFHSNGDYWHAHQNWF
jgi:hypothetical protein